MDRNELREFKKLCNENGEIMPRDIAIDAVLSEANNNLTRKELEMLTTLRIGKILYKYLMEDVEF